MRNYFTSELINGIIRVVEYIKYSNGKIVKRIYDSKGNIDDIQDIND